MIWILIIISYTFRGQYSVEIEKFNTQQGCYEAKKNVDELLPKGIMISTKPLVIECRSIKD